MAQSWYVYIGRLADGRYYVGITPLELHIRTLRHQTGLGGRFTRAHPVAAVLWFEKHASSESARLREVQLKGWSRAKKEALIRGDLSGLRALARSTRRRRPGGSLP